MRLSLFFPILFISDSALGGQHKTVSVLDDKPYFELKVESKNLEAHVLVNGVDVYSGFERFETNITTPINPWLAPDKNDFSIMFRSFGENGIYSDNFYANVELLVSNDNSKKKYTVLTMHLNNKMLEKGYVPSLQMGEVRLSSINSFTKDNKGDVFISKEVLDLKNGADFSRLNRSISMKINIPKWKFFDSDEVPIYKTENPKELEKYKQELLKEYLKVKNAIANNDADSVLSMFAERDREYDAAFFYEPGTTERKIAAALKNAAVDKDAELLNLAPEYVGFYTYVNPHLTKLIRSDYSPAIVQNFKKAQGSQSFDLIFRYKDGKWILTR